MAGMGPPPKDPKLRQRRNRPPVTQATLRMPPVDPPADSQDPAPSAPQLPLRGPGETPWHPDTLTFWKEVWASPMAPEYIAADIPGLVIVARLIDKFNYGAVELAGEIRLQRQCFGLTPLDRRRLQWEIERAEAAERRRPNTGVAMPAASGARDPRRNLRAVK
jgi:hypothetical protein